MRFSTRPVLSCLALSLACAGLAQAAPYTITNLGTLGGKQSYAAALNEDGLVVGHSSGPKKAGQDNEDVLEYSARAFLFNGTTMGQLGAVGHLGLIVNHVKDSDGNITSTTTDVPNSFANGVNRNGLVVGYGIVDADPSDITIKAENRPFIFSGDTLTNFGLPPDEDSTGAIAEAVNDDNLVVGRTVVRKIKLDSSGNPVLDSNGDPVKESFDRAFTYDVATQDWDILPVFDTDPTRGAFGLAINNEGVVTGSAGKLIDNVGFTRAYRWNPGDEALTDLGDFGGKSSYPHDINEAGHIVGYSLTDQFDATTGRIILQGFISVPGATSLTNLGFLSSAKKSSEAFGINDNGQVVGEAGVETLLTAGTFLDLNHAFLSQLESGTRVMRDLNGMLSCEDQKKWVLSRAVDINNKGQIAGIGVIDGQVRAFLLNPPAGSTSGTVVSCPAPEVPGDSGGGGSLGFGLAALLASLGLTRRR
ncbi:MAG: hypothetical protein HYV16_00750 [Gammaproteobacteria bacterium]|nr:hypothetical protein [Gammaproteobacteria bacterium]